MVRRLCRPLALMLSLTLASCSGDLYAGGLGHVDAEATSDGAPGGAQGSREAGSPTAPARVARGAEAPAAVPQGTLELTASVALLDESGAELMVSGEASRAVRLAGGDTVRLGGSDLPARTYPRARVRFTRVVARVQGGVLGVLGEVRVQMPAGEPLVVEAPVELRVLEDGSHAVVVDLNAAAWLPTAVGGVVPAAAFRAAVEIRAR